jgi:serine/threonine protein kinase
MLWGFYVMKNRGVLDHFSRRYEHAMHKVMPPLTIGAAGLSIAGAIQSLQTGAQPGTLSFFASIGGLATGTLGLLYGVYCMCVVIRTVKRSGLQSDLGSVQQYMRNAYSRAHYASLQGRDSSADFVAPALIESDFLQQIELQSEVRKQVAAAVEELEVDLDEVVWHEDEPFEEGGFSQVWRVQYRGKVVAAKVLSRTQGGRGIRKAEAWLNGVKREAAILRRLSACANIINVIGMFENSDGDVVLLMEYAAGGSLGDYLHGTHTAGMGTGTGKGGSTSSSVADSAGDTTLASTCRHLRQRPSAAAEYRLPLPHAEVLSILIDIARALEFCYTQTPPVQHRDLKPQNVLSDGRGRWILADFGISKVDIAVTSTYTRGTMCTPAWSSPEQLHGKHQGEPSDVWSFGVLMWEVITRQTPWEGKSAMEMMMASVEGQRLPMPEPPAASSPFFKDKAHAATRRALAKIIEGCWHAKPGKRPTFSGILGRLEALATGVEGFEEIQRSLSVPPVQGPVLGGHLGADADISSHTDATHQEQAAAPLWIPQWASQRALSSVLEGEREEGGSEEKEEEGTGDDEVWSLK